MGEEGDSEFGGHFPVWLQLVTRPQGVLVSWAQCCPLQATPERCSPRSVTGRGTVSHSKVQAAFPGRQAG